MVVATEAETQAADEAFWKRMEKRREKRLGQPCCTQSGMSWTMIDVPGDFAVVIHGEFDCVNCFHHHVGRSAHRYYSTRLSEADLTQGTTEEALEELLRLIAEHERPEAVLVLGTCPVEVINAPYLETVERVAAETGVPMVGLRTSGLALTSMPKMLDWLYVTLAKLPPGPPVDARWRREVARLALQAAFTEAIDPSGDDALAGFAEAVGRLTAAGDGLPEDAPRVNFLGLPEQEGRVPEPVLVLHKAGVAVNGTYPDGASLSSWRAIHHAAHTFVVDEGMYRKLTKRLKRGGQAVHALPPPVGIERTLAMYRVIGEATGRTEALMALVEPVAAQLRRKVAAFRRHARGIRLGYTLRMNNTYTTQALAHDGLGEVLALQELGFDLRLYIQGGGEPAVRAAHAEALAAHGVEVPFDTFTGPSAAVEALVRDRVHLAMVEDTVIEGTRRAGIPVLELRSLDPYLSGVSANLTRLTRALGQARRRSA